MSTVVYIFYVPAVPARTRPAVPCARHQSGGFSIKSGSGARCYHNPHDGDTQQERHAYTDCEGRLLLAFHQLLYVLEQLLLSLFFAVLHLLEFCFDALDESL